MKSRTSKATTSSRRPVNQNTGNKFLSYHASRQDQDKPKPQTRPSLGQGGTSAFRAARLSTKLPLILVGVVLVACLFYATTLTSSAKLVVTKKPDSVQIRPISEYQTKTDDFLKSSLLNLNKMTIDTKGLTDQLLNDFPELDSATVVLPLMGHRPVVEVSTSAPALIIASQSGVYIVDSSGKAIAPLKELGDGIVLNVPTVREEADLQLEAGKAAISKQDVTFITTVYKQFTAKKLKVESMTLPPLASELHVQLKGAKYYIKMSLLADPRLSAGQYLAFRKDKLDKGSVTPDKYVDVRVNERVYVK